MGFQRDVTSALLHSGGDPPCGATTDRVTVILRRTAVEVGFNSPRHDEFIKARIAAMEHLPRASRTHKQPVVTDLGNRDVPHVRLAISNQFGAAVPAYGF